MRKATLCLVVLVLLSFVVLIQLQARRPSDGVPVFRITPVDSNIKFRVDASTTIEGDLSKWDASLTFTSPDVTTGVLDVKIQADSVDTGSGVKNGKLKGGDLFAIRGVSKPEALKLTITGKGTGSGTIEEPWRLTAKNTG